jgi:hypothetical protein
VASGKCRVRSSSFEGHLQVAHNEEILLESRQTAHSLNVGGGREQHYVTSG